MSDKKNIDRLFQEKFKDFEATPNDAVWHRIEAELQGEKKKRRVIPVWWRVASVAALLLLLFTIGNSLFNTAPQGTLPVVDTEQPSTPGKTSNEQLHDDSQSADHHNNTKATELADQPSSGKTGHSPEQEAVHHQEGIANTTNTTDGTTGHEDTAQQPLKANDSGQRSPLSQKTKTGIAGNDKTATYQSNTNTSGTKAQLERHKEIVNTSTRNENSLAYTPHTYNISTTKIASVSLDALALLDDPAITQSIEDAIAEAESINEKEKEDEKNRWSIAPNVAPVYFSSFGEGSPIHSQFNQNTKEGALNMSYGINGGYAINDRLKVRAGIHRVDLSYTTTDVLVFTGADTQARGASSEINNIDFKGDVQSFSFISASPLNLSSIPELLNTKFEGDLDQRLGFVEVPLELEYRLVDRKLGVNLIGGFSTFFLSENEIYADVNGNNTLIGEANNINSTSYSANFGLGLDYGITKRLHVNLEPTFKYQINTFSNTFGDFQPFFIAVYTGLSFKF